MPAPRATLTFESPAQQRRPSKKTPMHGRSADRLASPVASVALRQTHYRTKDFWITAIEMTRTEISAAIRSTARNEFRRIEPLAAKPQDLKNPDTPTRASALERTYLQHHLHSSRTSTIEFQKNMRILDLSHIW
jgi:hypothetical protein